MKLMNSDIFINVRSCNCNFHATQNFGSHSVAEFSEILVDSGNMHTELTHEVN